MPDIMTKINDLNTAKSNIKTAIESKGVTVSSDKKLADYAGLISSISAGSVGSVITCNVENSSTNTVPSDFFDNYFLLLTYYNCSGTLSVDDVTSLAEPLTLSLLGDGSYGTLLLFESDCPYLSVQPEASGLPYPLVYDNQRQSFFNYIVIDSSITIQLHYVTTS